ncbi:MAG: hypothetical protein JO302_03580 [Candidatus Eremiobacteraeota bacterium]|nr:hypothetical protein [Candidatus Eremiobacteraeota bacterium]
MRTSLAPGPAVAAAFESLIDYAGLFPPAQLSVSDATAQYARERRGPHAWMLGRFIIPVSRMEELGHFATAFALSAIVDVRVSSADTSAWFAGALETFGALSRLTTTGARVEVLEIPLPELRQRRETHDAAISQLGALLERTGLRHPDAYVEWPRSTGWRDGLPGTMAAAARAGVGAKLRCGGLRPDQFPSVEEVASFIATAADAGVRFKATAGLHHPVRHYAQEAGATMHGFLNLLAAAVFAPAVGETTLHDIVAEEDPRAFAFDAEWFAWRDRRANVEQLKRARQNAFVTYGSCSFAEPLEDLIALGILPTTTGEGR